MLRALRLRFSGLADSIIRYPLTVLFLLATAVMIAISIGDGRDLLRYILTCVVGAVAGAAAQAAYERFFIGLKWRSAMIAAALLVTLLFYLSVMGVSENNIELGVRTAVTVFALFVVYMWVAVVKSPTSFSESFMAAFKALFQSALFSGVLFLGCVAIIAAIDQLITPVDGAAYSHTANIAFVLFAPLFFLSLIPVYPGRQTEQGIDPEQLALIERRTGCPRFLEVLLSYIVIPLASVFTVILLIYIILNIGGAFWTDNLLEPLLISYSIAVIVTMLLVGQLENRFARLFRMIFPKVLIPIALFQVIASVLLMTDTGVTYGRYFLILFGVFAVLSGVVLSLLPMCRSGIIAVILVVLSAISLVPPVDAFSVSRNSQIDTIETILERNGMLQNGTVTPNGSIPEEDKTRIIKAVQYLDETEDLGQVPWLPDNFNGYDDGAFFKTFGFHMYMSPDPGYRYVSVYYDNSSAVPIEGYDVLLQMSIGLPHRADTASAFTTSGGQRYQVFAEKDGDNVQLGVRDEGGTVLGLMKITDLIYDRFNDYPADKNTLTPEEATFTTDNDRLSLKAVVMNAGFTKEAPARDMNAQLYVLINIKP